MNATNHAAEAESCILCNSVIDDDGRAFWTDGESSIVQGVIIEDGDYIGFENGPYCGLACVIDDPLALQ